MYINWYQFIFFVLFLAGAVVALVKAVIANSLKKGETLMATGTIEGSTRFVRLHFITVLHRDYYGFTVNDKKFSGMHYRSARSSSPESSQGHVSVTYLVKNPRVNALTQDVDDNRKTSFFAFLICLVCTFIFMFNTFSLTPIGSKLMLTKLTVPARGDKYFPENLDVAIPWYVSSVGEYNQVICVHTDDFTNAMSEKNEVLGALRKPLSEIIQETVSLESLLLLQFHDGTTGVYSADRLMKVKKIKKWFDAHDKAMNISIEKPLIPYYGTKSKNIRMSLAAGLVDVCGESFIIKTNGLNENRDAWTFDDFNTISSLGTEYLPVEYKTDSLLSIDKTDGAQGIMINRGTDNYFGLSADELEELKELYAKTYPLFAAANASRSEGECTKEDLALFKGLSSRTVFIYVKDKEKIPNVYHHYEESPVMYTFTSNWGSGTIIYLLDPAYDGSPHTDELASYEQAQTDFGTAFDCAFHENTGMYICSGYGASHLVYYTKEALQKIHVEINMPSE